MIRTVLAAFAAIVLAGACSSARATIDRPARVEVFGDSIAAESAPQLGVELTRAGWVPYVDGHGGSAITGGLTVGSWPREIQQELTRFRPNVVVIELGTNGCSCGSNLATGIDDVMRVLRGVNRVYWINVRVGAPIPSQPVAINDAIENATDRWPNLHVIDMNRRFRHSPELITADHIHLNTPGIAVFAEMIVSALPKVVTA